MSGAPKKTQSDSLGISPEAKAEMQRWIDRWKWVGPLLDEDRWRRLQRCSEEELTRQALDVLDLWRPDVPGDNGEALVIQQQTFRKMRTGLAP